MKLINRRYRVEGEIGQGSYGVIYKVSDLQDEKNPSKTLKIYNTDKLVNQDLDAFKNEYFYTKSIDLPCAVKAHTFEKIYNIDGFSFYGNYYFYTMNYIRGKNISSLKLSTKKERSLLAERLLFTLKWLESNGFGHSDLHRENILVDENSQIILLDFIQPKIIQLEEDDLKAFIKEITGHDLAKALIDHQKLKFRNICPKAFFDFVRKYYRMNIGTIGHVKSHFDRALTLSEKAKIFRINAVNYKDNYYDILNGYFKSYSEINEYFYIELDLSKDPLTYFNDFRNQMMKSLDLRGIKSSEITKDETIIDKDSKALDHIISSIEKLSLYGKVAVSFKGNNRKNELTETIEAVEERFKGEGLLILTPILSDSGKSSGFYNICEPPDSDKFENFLKEKIKNIFYALDVDDIIDYMRKNGNYDICRILENVLRSNRSLKSSSRTLNLINKNALNRIFEDKYRRIKDSTDYEYFFSYFELLKRPVDISLLKLFLGDGPGKSLDEIIYDLLGLNLLAFQPGGALDYYDRTTEVKVRSYFKKEDFKNKASYDVIKYLEKKNLRIDEEKLLLNLYFSTSQFFEYSRFLFSHFIEPFRNLNSIEKIAEDFIYKIESKNLLKSVNLPQGLPRETIKYIYIKLKNKFDLSRKIENLLDFVEKDQPCAFIKYNVLFDVFSQYLNSGDMENSKSIYDVISVEKENLGKYQNLAFLIYRAKFYTLFSEFEKSISDLRDFFRNVHKEKDDKTKYLTLKALEILADLYHKQGKMQKFANTIRIFLEKAKVVSDENGDLSYFFSANTDYAYYHFNYGKRSEAKKYFQKALELAQTYKDYNDLILASNNLAAIENDTKITLEYLRDALKYSNMIGENVYIYLVISNILSLNIDPVKKYGFIRDNMSIILNCNTDHEISVKFCLDLYYSIICILLSLDKKEELSFFFEKLEKIEIEKQRMPDAFLLKKIVQTFYQISLNGYKKDYFNIYYKLLDEFNDIYNYSIIVYMYINSLFYHLDDSQIVFISKKIISLFKDIFAGDEINSVRMFVKLKTSKFKKESLKRYIERYVSGLSNLNYLSYRIIFILSQALKGMGDDEYKNLLSYSAEELVKTRDSFKNKRLFKKTMCFRILCYFKNDFPSEYNRLIEKKEKFQFTKNSFLDLNRQLQLNYFSENQVLIKNVISAVLRSLNYDRGAFFTSLQNKIPQIVVYRKKYYYSEDDPYFIDKIPLEKSTEVFTGLNEDKYSSIKSFISIPVVNELYYKRFMHRINREKSRRSSLTKSLLYENNIIDGLIYLDKKNGLSDSFNPEYLNLLSFTLSQYWNYNRAEKLYMRDGLTNLYLRNVFLNKLREMIHREEERVHKLSLIMVDIDDFKNVNDLFGHSRGDYVLKKLSEIMVKKIRSSDLVGRYGGEEFLIALPNTNIHSAVVVAQKIREVIEKSQIIGDAMKLTISCGVAEYPKDSQWLEELIEKTDKYLIKAKNLGKNRVVSSIDENST
ncbi:diguanylate cyclase [candidate division WOR-3 bacterium]|nr:diguanylate cyclase [candidate division WOR-3 bacterium]